MKKLLIAMSAAGAFALCASAIGPAYGDTGFISGTTFSALTPGDPLDVDADDTGSSAVGADLFWSAEQGADLSTCIISNAAAAIATPTTRPAAWSTSTDTTQYLSIDIDKRLSRNVNPLAAPQAIGDGLYFDSLVQFTATDTLPTVSEGDKLVVWLYGGEEDSEDVLGLGADKVSTNLVVTAGYVEGTSSTLATNYVVTLPQGVTVEPNSWHRLTIKAYANITQDGETSDAAKIGGFVVYIDGEAVTSTAVKGDFSNFGEEDTSGLTTQADALNYANKLFPSLLKAGREETTNLTCVAFEGTGAVDDLTFTTTDPFPEAAPFEYTVTVADEAGAAGDTTFAVDGGSAQAFISGTPISVPVSATTIDFVVKVYDGYKLSNAGAVKGATVDGDNYYDWTLSVAVSTLAKDGTDALTLTVVEDSGAATTFTLTLAPGTGTTLSASVGGEPVNSGVGIEDGAQVTITAALSDAEAYEDLVVTVGGVDVTSQLVNGSYTFTMTAATTVATSATAITPSEDWPTGTDLDSLAGTAVSVNYPGVPAALANADAKTFVTWASGVGGVAYADRASTTYNVDCFLLNIANDSTPEQIAAAKATAEEAIKITAISVDDGVVTITAPATYGNGKVVVQGSVALVPASWHAKAAGDYFFRTALVVDEVE